MTSELFEELLENSGRKSSLNCVSVYYEENPHKNLRSELEPFLADDCGISQEFWPNFRPEKQMN